jgi:predicted GIY-YIG superfamily endonuclease
MAEKVSTALVALPTKLHALYRFYDRTDVLLYVGITMDLGSRMKQHKRDKPWWAGVANITVEHFPTRDEALAAEKRAIKEEGPLYNDQHNQFVAAAAGSGAQDFAKTIVRILAEDEETYQRIVEVATRTVAEAAFEDDDEVAGMDPVLYAAEHGVADLWGRERRLVEALQLLFGVVPHTCLDHATTSAEELFPGEWATFERFLHVAKVVTAEVAEISLNTVDPMERTVWRLAAERAVAIDANGHDVSIKAAEMVQQFHNGKLTHVGMCRAAWSTGATCPRRATVFAWLVDCPRPECAEDCIGHLVWCDRHGREATSEQGLESLDGGRFQVARIKPAPLVERSRDAATTAERLESQMRHAERGENVA